MVRIGVIGDYSSEVKTHIAIPQALQLVANDLEVTVDIEWIPTPQLESNVTEQLKSFDGLWAAPATPYVSMDGALAGIRYAREHEIPFLGTCGGYQHMLIEFARHVIGLTDAEHAESSPDASTLIVTPLSCSMNEQTHQFVLVPASRIARIYNATEIQEQYGICNYGLNPAFRPLFAQHGLHISATDLNGEARIAELEDHPFYIGTLFQPERSAFQSIVHPLIRELVRTASVSA